MNSRKIFITLWIVVNALGCISAQNIPLGMATSFDNDSLLYVTGFRYIGTSVSNLISPSLPDSVFKQKLEVVKRLRCKVIMCNVLFPGEIKIAGPDVKEDVALAYLEKVLMRAKTAGVKNLILGSGGARKLPPGYDVTKAKTDFVLLAQKMARLAKQHDIRIILENLNSGETNFLNTLAEAADIVRRVDQDNFRLNADIYHMMREQESPDAIRDAGSLIVYSEIAERENRTLPGVMKENFIPYLQALKDIGFKGPIVIEGNSDNLQRDVPIAFHYLTQQINGAYSK